MEKNEMQNQEGCLDCGSPRATRVGLRLAQTEGPIGERPPYVPPKIGVSRVLLEGSICAGSAQINSDTSVQQSWNTDNTDNRDITW